MRWPKVLVITGGTALMSGGCGTSAPALNPEAFIRPGLESGMVTSQTDANGAIVYGQLHAPILPKNTTSFAPSSLPPRPRKRFASRLL